MWSSSCTCAWAGVSSRRAASRSWARPTSAMWTADMRLMFWGSASFVLIGLLYVMAIGWAHR
jgi:hypothetical protein